MPSEALARCCLRRGCHGAAQYWLPACRIQDGTMTDCLVTRTSQDIIHASASTGGISGSGDTLAALMIAHLLSYPDDDIASAAKAACSVTSRLMANAPSPLTMSVDLS